MITSHRPHQHPHHAPHFNPWLLIAIGALIIVVFAVITSVKVPEISVDMEKVTADTRPRFAYPAAAADEFPVYHRSEWGVAVAPAIGAKGLEQYHLSERTWVPANAGLIMYRLSERTMIPADAGLIQYHESERTQIVYPIDPNDPLYRYRLSEWFGK